MPARIATTIASTLGLYHQRGGSDPGPTDHLQAKPTLLIFDSCEHVLEDLGAAGRTHRSRGTDCMCSRPAANPFAAKANGSSAVSAGLPAPARDLAVADILAYPAAQLFVERIAQSSGHFSSARKKHRWSRTSAGRLDGIALAIELAAGRVNAYGIAGTASLLDSRFSLQWRGRRTAVPRHQTLSAALDWSYDLLLRIRERHVAKPVGVRRALHAGGGCRCRVRRRPRRVRNAGGDRQSRHQIADLTIRLANAALSPARHHTHLCASAS